MVRILQYLGGLGIGGTQAFVINVYNALNHEKIQFDFVVHDFKTSNCESQQLNYGYSGRWNLQTLWDFHEIERILNAVLTIC